MTVFTSALTTGPDWKTILADVGSQLADGRRQPGGLGPIYTVQPLADHFADIIQTLRQRTGVEHWASCVGLGVCGSTGDYHHGSALSVLVAPWADEVFQNFTTVSSADALVEALSGG
ncbi:MAG: hypothetical protein P8L66_03000 [Rhodospirillaceae bacterium]|nr:hypothetical protein [Rhodospirillaceae bacterium]